MPLIGARRALLTPTRKLWTPLQLKNSGFKACWWGNRDLGSIAFANNGSYVQGWEDKISGLVATQANAANQPTWSAVARNGRPGLLFDGAASFLTLPSNAILPVNAADGLIIVSAYSRSTANALAFCYGYAHANQWRAVGQAATSSNATGSFYSADLTSSMAWNGQDRTVALQASGGTNTLYVDEAIAGTSTGAPATNGSAGAIGRGIAGDYGAGLYWNGVIGDIIVLSPAPPTSIRQKLFAYISWASGQNGANLSSSNPWKYRPPYVSDP